MRTLLDGEETMNLRTTVVLAAALLAARAGAEGDGGEAKPPADQQPAQRSTAEKARELGDRGTAAAKRGATSARDKVNEAGQAVSARAVGTQSVTGRVAEVGEDQVTVEQSDGTPLRLRVTRSTKVTSAGKEASAAALRPGDEVRASYAQSGGSATATKIEKLGKAAGRSTPGARPSR